MRIFYLEANTHKLKNILKLLDFKSSQTISMDEIEHHGLDPWVQWVSIHTGVPHKEHKITFSRYIETSLSPNMGKNRRFRLYLQAYGGL